MAANSTQMVSNPVAEAGGPAESGVPSSFVINTSPRSDQQTQHAPADKLEARLLNIERLVAGQSIDTVDIHVVTWNVGNKQPAEDLTGLVPRQGAGYGLIAIGLQEATYSVKEKREIPSEATFVDGTTQELFEFYGCVQKWLADVRSRFIIVAQSHGELLALAGGQYQPVASQKLLEMRLMVFCHKALAPQITQVATMDEATGLAHVVGNKGGTAVRLKVGQTSFAFISCHLAAHEGEEYLKRRNSDCAEILAGIRMGAKAGCEDGLDILAQTDHVFWIGDLNYRLNLVLEGCKIEHPICDALREGKKEMDKKELAAAQYSVVTDLIEQEKWQLLWSADQLSNSIAKVVYDKPGMHYNPQRTPSYCDRILWKSNPSLEMDVQQTGLDSSPQVSSSDHKPVWSTFSVRTHDASFASLLPYTEDSADFPDIVLNDISGSGLLACDPVHGSSDPYLRFMMADAIVDPGMSTRCKSTVEPVFSDTMIPLIRCKIASREVLATKSLTVALFDYDIESKDDEMGFIRIPLQRVIEASPSPVEFCEKVTLNGVPYGELNGTIRIVWPEPGGLRIHREQKQLEACCKCVTM